MSWIHNLSKKRLFSEFGRVVFILDNVIPNPKKLYQVNIMGKKISPNNLAENRSESRNIPDKFIEENYGASEEYHIPLVKKEALERDLHEDFEPFYFYKGAVLSLFFCLPFWIILFKLIT